MSVSLVSPTAESVEFFLCDYTDVKGKIENKQYLVLVLSGITILYFTEG